MWVIVGSIILYRRCVNCQVGSGGTNNYIIQSQYFNTYLQNKCQKEQYYEYSSTGILYMYKTLTTKFELV